jgi:hypothetical protein
MDLKEIGLNNTDWNILVLNGNLWMDLVNMVMNVWLFKILGDS